MKKNGFTLVELLATIAILGLLSVIGGTVGVGIKKSTDKKELETISKELQTLGSTIYADAKISGKDGDQFVIKYNNINFRITLEQLKRAGYLKNIPTDNNDYICFKNKEVYSCIKDSNDKSYENGLKTETCSCSTITNTLVWDVDGGYWTTP